MNIKPTARYEDITRFLKRGNVHPDGSTITPIVSRDSCHTDEQVDHDDPNQVRSIEDLVPGAVYQRMHGPEQYGVQFTVERTPKSGEETIPITRHPAAEKPVTSTLFLTDMGIIPNEAGSWNAHNYVVRVD